MNHKITALVVDDDARSRDVLNHHLKNIPDISVIGTARGADEALSLLLEAPPDILFLDVEMPGKNGFDLVAELQRLKISTCIVFQTAYDQYAIQAIKHSAFDFLLKPIDPEELKTVVSKYRSSHKQTDLNHKIDQLMLHLDAHKKIRFNTRQGFIMIDPAEIVYCQADWSYTEIYFVNGKMHVVSMNMGKVEGLLNPAHFFRINRSVMVRIDSIVTVNRKAHQCTILYGGKEISFKIPAGNLRRLSGLLGG